MRINPTGAIRMRRLRGAPVRPRLAGLLAAAVLLLTPSHSPAAPVDASVDQVLGALAEVVKDRAKAEAARTIRDKLADKLCKGDPLTIHFSDKDDKPDKRTFFLGGYKDRCAEGNYADIGKCTGDDLFVKSCRLIKTDSGVQLTDPYFLKTLSRDTVGFAVRLAAYRLDDKQFKALNLEPFTDFLHGVMDLMARGRPDLASFSGEVDKLVDSYTSSDTSSVEVINDISQNSAIKALLEKVNNLIPPDKTQIPIDGKPEPYTIKAWNCTKSLNDSKKNFKALFGDKGSFWKAIDASCSDPNLGFVDAAGQVKASEKDELENCRKARLAFSLRPALEKLSDRCRATTPTDAERDIRNILHVLEDEEDKPKIYTEALGSDREFKDFSSAVRKTLLKDRKLISRMAISDSLELIASMAQALSHEPREASDWLKGLRVEMHTGDIHTYRELRETHSLKWFNRDKWPPYTRKMRDSFAQMLSTVRLLAYNPDDESQEFHAVMDTAMRLSDTAVKVASEKREPSVGDMVGQIKSLIPVVADIIQTAGKGDDELQQFADGLKALNRVLEHGEKRDWVAVGFDISGDLDKLRVENTEFQNSLRFSRVLLSMYQADSVDEAKAIFQSALENESSRETRYNNPAWTLDVGALAGAHLGYGWQSGQRSSSIAYGVFAPFGVMGACSREWKRLGWIFYPVDLGGYLSGTGGNTPAVRVQSALHSGIAVYGRPWARIPLVFGAAGDYKPSFAASDSIQWRAFAFAALELPLYIIH